MNIPEQCNLNDLVNLLKNLSEQESLSNPKKYYSSYPIWDKQSNDQKNKTQSFWNLLTEATREKVIQQCLAISANQNSDSNNESRAANTTKHELARILHLRKDPLLMAFWTQVDAGFASRRALDSRNSTSAPGLTPDSTLADEANPYDKIAEKFNDPALLYQNAVILYYTPEGLIKILIYI